MTMTDAQRASMIAKVKAILAKCAPSANSTEAEALAAFAKARELMDRYDLDDVDLALDGETACETATFHRALYKGVDLYTYLTIPVARFTGTRNWREAHGRKTRRGESRDDSIFFGRPSDLLFAEWLLSTLVDFAKRNHDITFTELTLDGEMLSPRWSYEFLVGCCRQIADKLFELASPAQRPSGTNALTVQSLVDHQMRERFPDRWKQSMGVAGGGMTIRTAGYRAGRAAGLNATFSRPVGPGSGKPKLLGR